MSRRPERPRGGWTRRSEIYQELLAKRADTEDAYRTSR